MTSSTVLNNDVIMAQWEYPDQDKDAVISELKQAPTVNESDDCGTIYTGMFTTTVESGYQAHIRY